MSCRARAHVLLHCVCFCYLLDNAAVNAPTYPWEDFVILFHFAWPYTTHHDLTIVTRSNFIHKLTNFIINQLDMEKIRIQIRHNASYSKAGCWNILKKQAAEFCSNTGLHGYKYISQTQRPKTERYVEISQF